MLRYWSKDTLASKKGVRKFQPKLVAKNNVERVKPLTVNVKGEGNVETLVIRHFEQHRENLRGEKVRPGRKTLQLRYKRRSLGSISTLQNEVQHQEAERYPQEEGSIGSINHRLHFAETNKERLKEQPKRLRSWKKKDNTLLHFWTTEYKETQGRYQQGRFEIQSGTIDSGVEGEPRRRGKDLSTQKSRGRRSSQQRGKRSNWRRSSFVSAAEKSFGMERFARHASKDRPASKSSARLNRESVKKNARLYCFF
ncbi:hypothetical protein TNIN_265381 [Trichonephila inaurata madagascariensis]|uniref:Uncharacterized protein n=1 Tax=Trichonephila inaurata madagascariensis TaxID=2747483 RepID=A0A8X6WV34_9ARAC|nr:hypothetical protein TNIN_265381 [Trichonephila inaurata madagascariensis]